MMNILIQSQNVSCSSEVPTSMWIPSSSTLYGPKIMSSYEKLGRGAPEFRLLYRDEDGEDDDDDDGSYNPQGKKRRLSENQVQFLDKNFQAENKLEPERKVQLAKESRLQPRQVAVWFQNRRARFKNKKLEKDYASLKSSYEKLNSDYGSILKEKQNLENQIETLKAKLLNREKRKQGFDFVQIGAIDSKSRGPIFDSVTETVSNLPLLSSKPEEASSGKKVVFSSDSESPIYTDWNNSLSIEPVDSSNVFEPEQSEEEDNNYGIPIENSSCFGFPIVNQSLWSSFY